MDERTEARMEPATDSEEPAEARVSALSVSWKMLFANLLIVVAYSLVFGWRWVGIFVGDYQQPEHWEWIGGIVGLFALVIRGAVIAVIIVPYVYMSLSGLDSATRSLGNDRTRAVAVFLVIAHLVLLIPPGQFCSSWPLARLRGAEVCGWRNVCAVGLPRWGDGTWW